ncbi:MAG: aldo/keto reductase [Demequinaceae bacterium]|nr:aldo/keto reductase [Demequinaceae bacterium]
MTEKRRGIVLSGGRTVVPLALGAMNMGTLTPEEESRRILDHFIGEVTPRYVDTEGKPAAGMLDTADCYCWWNDRGSDGGHSESVIGRWLADSGLRDAVYLATKGTGRIEGVDKAWGRGGDPDWEYAQTHFLGASKKALEESLPGSLERLGVDVVDLYYVHVDDRRTPLEETLATLAGFVADGRIGAYGWSNVPSWRLAQIEVLCAANGWPVPLAIQQEHSYLHLKAGISWGGIVSPEQFDFLRETPGLALVAYSPILKGIYDKPESRKDHWIMPRYAGPDAEAKFAALDDVARETGATPNQIVLAWMMGRKDVTVLPLMGPRTWDQYIQLVEALDVRLTEEQVARLDAAGA